jgi:deoxycytidine triphosphate deaminase
MTGIFVKQDIEEAIDNRELLVNANKSNVQACSYDLRIGTIFRQGQVINDTHPDANLQIIIQPGEIISLFTLEELVLPDNIMATVFAINTMSSRGLLVLNPGHIDPGFQGSVSVKALNLRKVPLAITRGTRIFTVVFEKLPKSTTTPYSRNISKDQREQEYNEQDVEQAPTSLAELISFGKDSLYPTRQEVKEIVQQHWTTWLTLILTFIASLTGIISIFLAIGLNQKC